MWNTVVSLALPLTFSQIADGGDLEPQMLGLTTKFNKMQKDTINNENPAIGNVLLAGVPMRVFGEEIVETTEGCPFCEDGKVTSGTWLQRGATGTPCCWSCYVKA